MIHQPPHSNFKITLEPHIFPYIELFSKYREE